KEPFAFVPKQGKSLAGQGGNDEVGQAIVVKVAEVNPHARNRFPVVRQARAGGQSGLLESSVTAIAKEEIGYAVVRDEDVRKTVSVVIREGGAHAFPDEPPDAGLGGDVFKRSISAIVIERVRQSPVRAWSTVDAKFSRRVAAGRIEAGGPSDVVNDEQIQKTVIVIIKPTSAHCPAMALNAGAGRSIRECLVAVVAIQNVSINARNKQID